MKQYKDVLTTGQVAKHCRVSQKIARDWIDKGLLKGYKIPGSKDRRVRREDFVAFVEQHGMTFCLKELES